mgnify:CR=1 FL=1
MKKVVAIALGFYNGARVRKGSVISVPAHFRGSWVADVETPAAQEAQKVPEPMKPMALSELGKAAVEGPLEAGPTSQPDGVITTDSTDLG